MSDSIIRMLLNIQGKTKYGMNTHLDLVEMSVRQQLAPQRIDNQIYWCPTCHNLSRKEKEKKSFCECLRRIKEPQDYSLNVNSRYFFYYRQTLFVIGQL